MSDQRSRFGETRLTELSAALALTAYTLVIAAGFARVFSGWEFFDNLAVVAVAGHAISFAFRHARTPIWLALPATVAILAWIVVAMFYRDTMSLLLPTRETWDRLALDLDLVGNNFPDAVAPVLFLEGWNLLAAIGVGASALLADTFAFRAYARAESLVPGGVLFVFVAALGDERNRVPLTMALVGAGVVATVLLREHHAPAAAASISSGRRFSPARALPIAAGSALTIALIAGVVGPRLPGAEAEAIYDATDGSGDSVTEVISPLVDIQSRLTNRSTTELFSVTADGESYWRSAALADFDGQRWGIPPRDLNRPDSLGGQGAPGTTIIRQRIEIASLGGLLLPAAADPIAASGIGDVSDKLRISGDGATLVKTGEDLARGDTFVIESASPRFTAAELAGATSNDPGDDIYFELPDGLAPIVQEKAEEVTAGTSTPYEAAIAIQDWMRNEFTYSLEIQRGHDNSAIESFLINQVGYCEQFSGTYATMMRTLGIPARVAVGFTSGTNDGEGNYSVLGRNAHAWPEVWFDGFGWVPFEPTPGRGLPNAQDYTGVPPQQDNGPVDPDETDTTTQPNTPQPTAPPPTANTPGTGPTESTVPARPTPPTTPATTPDEIVRSGGGGGGSSIPWQPFVVVLIAATAAIAPALVRRARRSATTTPEARLAQLWDRATGALGALGLEYTPDRTPTETASATAAVFPVASRPMSSLAEVITEANFSPNGAERLMQAGGSGTTLLQNCIGWCGQIERAVSDSLTPGARIRRHFTVWR